ncbi:MAG TPA: glycosyltransferase [Sphingomicrobium sp.]|nr:glycosyltransferase [Sphingomicrobium sp.]
MKRYPRLTETFILNEIRAMERYGADLQIFSLLAPEPPPHHPIAAEVAAPVHSAPLEVRSSWALLGRSHAVCAAASPHRYALAFAKACIRSAQSARPLSVWRQFIRAGFVAAICRRDGVGHLHAHFANAPAAVAQFASEMTGILFSFTAHAKDLYLTSKRVIRRRVRAAQFVSTCTGYNVRYIETLLGARSDKVHLVYHGIDLGQFGARTDLKVCPGTPPLILSVGRLVPKKGHDDLIAACAILRSRGVEFRCRIVGEGGLRSDLQAQINSAGLKDIVALEGAMTHNDLIALYREAQLFALSPRIADDGDRDGIPNVIAEAMAIGVPVVSTEVSGIPELVRDGVTGALVPPRDPAALADEMAMLLADDGLRQSLAQAARALLERDFDLWATTRKLHQLMLCSGCREHAVGAYEFQGKAETVARREQPAA